MTLVSNMKITKIGQAALFSVSAIAALCTAPSTSFAASSVQFDTNGTPGLQLAEMERLCRAVEQQGKRAAVGGGYDACIGHYYSVVNNQSDGQSYPIDMADKVFFPPKSSPRFGSFSNLECPEDGPQSSKCDGSLSHYTSSLGFFLRRDHTQFRLFSDNNTVRGLGRGALFSYQYDFTADKDIALAKGALMYPVLRNLRDEHIPKSGFFIIDQAFIPSLTFDFQDNNVNPGRDSDSLTLRMATEFHGKWAGSQYNHFVWLGGTYDTDVEFNSSTLAVEAEWKPLNLSLAMGAFQQVYPGSTFEYAWQPKLHLEAGKTIRQGNGTLADGSDFARIGPAVDFWLNVSPQFQVTASGHYYTPITQDSEADWNAVAALHYYPFEGNDHVTVSLEYETGRKPFKLNKRETITLGLGIKF